jgi:hypothetical protein
MSLFVSTALDNFDSLFISLLISEDARLVKISLFAVHAKFSAVYFGAAFPKKD